jgi:hypothetical protein
MDYSTNEELYSRSLFSGEYDGYDYLEDELNEYYTEFYSFGQLKSFENVCRLLRPLSLKILKLNSQNFNIFFTP